MAEVTALPHRAQHGTGVPWHAAVGASDACNAVTRILQHAPVPAGHGDLDSDRAESGAVFLGQLLYAVRVANGISPRMDAAASSTSRGAELARRFLSADRVEICCPFCGTLMMEAIAEMMAGLMEQLHGPDAVSRWQALAAAFGLPGAPRPEPAEMAHPF